jgi:hypothetical protein
MSTPEKPTLEQWLDWAKRKPRAARNKYKAVAELRTKNNRTVVLRFANLTFKEAQAFQNVFDKFNHTHSDADLVFHGWEKVEPAAPVEHNPYIFTPRDVDLLYRQSQYLNLKQEDRDAINLRIAALNTEGELK